MTDTVKIKYEKVSRLSMLSTHVIRRAVIIPRIKLINFQERPACPECKVPLIICSHSTPSKVIGFEEFYYTEYVEYTCSEKTCLRYKRRKIRAVNPWRIDRHKYDLEVEAEVAHQRFEEKKTYREIKQKMFRDHGLKMSQKTIGSIISRYEISSKSENLGGILQEFKQNGGVFLGIDAMAPLKGEDKHIVAMDHFTGRTVLVERVRSENTAAHVNFQRKLKKITEQNGIKVLGFMSDDHRAQRKAILQVWGPKMKHCRCLFHFKKRIMAEPFKLNSQLKTDARARIRKIWHVQAYREGRLPSIKDSPIWEYLQGIIKDLVALQAWKTKRNDTNLESILFYERLSDLHRLLLDLKDRMAPTPKSAHKREKVVLSTLLGGLKSVLTGNKEGYEVMLRIKGYQDRLREIFNAHEESSREGLERLTEFARMLETKLKAGLVTRAEERSYIENLYTFVYDRGESLFQYRDIKDANNTNNSQETRFKTVKQGIRRTQGTVSASRYLQAHGKYMMFVDPHASREEIKRILMNADNKEVARIMKEDRAERRRPLATLKNDKRWAARKKRFKEKLQEI